MLTNTERQQIVEEVNAGTYGIDEALDDIAAAQKGEEVRKALYAEALVLNREGHAGSTDMIARQKIANLQTSVNGQISTLRTEVGEDIDDLETALNSGLATQNGKIAAQNASIANVVKNYNLEYGSETLWEATGETGLLASGTTATLSKDVSNFDYVDIYSFCGNINVLDTVPVDAKLQSTQGYATRWVNLSDPGSGTYQAYVRIVETRLHIIGTTLTIDHQVTYRNGEEVNISGAEITQSNRSTYMGEFGIMKIVGRKITANTEIEDVRIGADGTEYDSAGQAVRGQITEVKAQIPLIDASLATAGKAADAKAVGGALANVNGRLDGQGEDIFELQAGGYVADQQQIGAKINAWLTDHPEATTTVQDGAITEQKLASALKLKTIKDYVTPEMFGAVGDGSTDDTSAFEAALNTGKPVFLSNKTYRLASAINNPTNIFLFGSGRNQNGTIINCESSFLANAIYLSVIKDVGIIAPFNNELVAFPSNVTYSIISGCYMQYWYGVFNTIKTCSVIENNGFQFIRSFFCKILIDSFIISNYINAPKLKNPRTVCFNETIAHSVISNNFIDYMYKVFECSYMGGGVTVTGNVFDLCYTIVYNLGMSMTFTGNLMTSLTKSENWDVSENEDMNTKPWAVIRRESSSAGLTNCVFAGNTFDYRYLDAYMVCTAYSYPTRFLKIDDNVPFDKITFKARKSQYEYDLENVMIVPMLKRTVDSLPKPALTGDVVSFNYDQVVFNGDLYMNIGGTWKQLTN